MDAVFWFLAGAATMGGLGLLAVWALLTAGVAEQDADALAALDAEREGW